MAHVRGKPQQGHGSQNLADRNRRSLKSAQDALARAQDQLKAGQKNPGGSPIRDYRNKVRFWENINAPEDPFAKGTPNFNPKKSRRWNRANPASTTEAPPPPPPPPPGEKWCETLQANIPADATCPEPPAGGGDGTTTIGGTEPYPAIGKLPFADFDALEPGYGSLETQKAAIARARWAIESLYNPLMDRTTAMFDRRSDRGMEAIQRLYGGLAGHLEGLPADTRAAFDRAYSDQQATASELSRLTGTPTPTPGLAGIAGAEEDPSAVAEGSTAALFSDAASTLDDLASRRAGAESYAEALPGIAGMGAVEQANAFQRDLAMQEAEATDQMRSQIPGLVVEEANRFYELEFRKAVARADINDREKDRLFQEGQALLNRNLQRELADMGYSHDEIQRKLDRKQRRWETTYGNELDEQRREEAETESQDETNASLEVGLLNAANRLYSEMQYDQQAVINHAAGQDLLVSSGLYPGTYTVNVGGQDIPLEVYAEQIGLGPKRLSYQEAFQHLWTTEGHKMRLLGFPEGQIKGKIREIMLLAGWRQQASQSDLDVLAGSGVPLGGTGGSRLTGAVPGY